MLLYTERSSQINIVYLSVAFIFLLYLNISYRYGLLTPVNFNFTLINFTTVTHSNDSELRSNSNNIQKSKEDYHSYLGLARFLQYEHLPTLDEEILRGLRLKSKKDFSRTVKSSIESGNVINKLLIKNTGKSAAYENTYNSVNENENKLHSATVGESTTAVPVRSAVASIYETAKPHNSYSNVEKTQLDNKNNDATLLDVCLPRNLTTAEAVRSFHTCMRAVTLRLRRRDATVQHAEKRYENKVGFCLSAGSAYT